jgi:hypothetical protein
MAKHGRFFRARRYQHNFRAHPYIPCTMMSFFVALISAGLALASAKLNPDTVDTLDVKKYLGDWYQVNMPSA